MPKIKAPLLSFRADGSIGKSITFAQTQAGQIAKSIPSHRDANSYAQRLQRSRFLDAIYYWRSLSSAAREAYKVTARPLNMTGWAYYLSQYLPSPPDQVLWLTLDHIIGGIAADRSPQANHGTVFGAIPRTDLIHNCLDFDQIDDRVTIASAPSLDFTTAMTAMLWLRPTAPSTAAAQASLITKRRPLNTWQFVLATGKLVFTFFTAGGELIGNLGATTLTPNLPQHVAITWDNVTTTLYYQGLPDGTTAMAGPMLIKDTPVQLAAYDDTTWPYGGQQDEARLYNRCLSPEHIHAIAHGLYYPERLI